MSRLSRLSRLAATLPLCALLAGPAAAQQYFTFELTSTFNGLTLNGPNTAPTTTAGGETTTFTITGQSTTDISGTPWSNNPVRAAVDLTSLNLTVSGELANSVHNISLYQGPWWLGTGGNKTTPSAPVFRFTEAGGDITVRARNADQSIVWQLNTDFGLAWFGFGGVVDLNRATAVTQTQGTNDDVSGVVFFDQNSRTATVEAQTSATLVPEINGSGFAYIAFILGALGLWLYSGAGRREAEGLAAS